MRLLVDITSHGWGHLSQTAPIVDALRSRMPGLKLVVRSGLPEDVLRSKLGPLAAVHSSDTDFGMVMKSPFAVDRSATLERYRKVHADFDQQVDRVSELIERERCDLVFSNVGYLSLAAAKRAGIPSVACSSLEWGGMFRFYCAGLPGADSIADAIDTVYAGADAFVQLLPGMVVDRWPTMKVDRVIARLGTPRRQALSEQLDLKSREVVALLAFGGMLPDHQPLWLLGVPGLRLIGPDTWSSDGFIPVSSLAMPYEDVLASADVVVTKSGYGIVSELGCLGTPSIIISRGDWLEEEAHLDWLEQHAAIQRCPSLDGVTATNLFALAGRPRLPSSSQAGGEAAVVDVILSIALQRIPRS